MRTHKQIISDVGVPRLRDALGMPDKTHTIRSWLQRKRIPAKHWAALSNAGLASLEELASERAA